MKKRDVSLTIALSASLLGHGGVAYLAVHGYAQAESEKLAGFARTTYINLASPTQTNQGLLAAMKPQSDAPPEQSRPLPEQLLEPTLPPPPPPSPPEPPAIRPSIGDSIGGGLSANRTPGEVEMQARQSNTVQADSGLTPPGARASGAFGAGGQAGNPGEPGNPGHPGETTPPQAQRSTPTAPPPADTPPRENASAQVPPPAPGSDGLMKQGSADPSAEFGTGTPLPEKLPTLPTPASPPPPKAEQKPQATPHADEAPQRNDSRGKAQANPSETARPDDQGRTTEVTPDQRPPGEKENPPTPLPPKQGQTLSDRQGSSPHDSAGPQKPEPGQQRDAPPSPTRPESSSQKPESPKGEETSKSDERREGLPEIPKPPEEGPGKVPEVDKPGKDESAEKPQSAPDQTPIPTPASPVTPPSATPQPVAPPASAGDSVLGPTTPEQFSLAPVVPPPAASSPPARTPASPANPRSGGGANGGGNGGDGLPPGPPSNRGESSYQSDTESDPFQKNGSVTFRAGRIDARFGRKVKWVKPRLTLAGQLDAGFSSSSAVVLSVSTDVMGKVTRVEVLQSSGSPNTIDLPVIRAVYSWWIEPPVNAKGEPVPDTMVWRIELKG